MTRTGQKTVHGAHAEAPDHSVVGVGDMRQDQLAGEGSEGHDHWGHLVL